MTPTRPTMFGRLGRMFACTGAVSAALLTQWTFAGDSVSRNIVFKSADGEAWTVSIKPAQRTARVERRAVSVPEPADLVQAALAQEAPPPQPGVVPEGTPAELPPVPAMTIGSKGSGATTAHGVAVLPNARAHFEVAGRQYADAYRSIPFNRAEYDANPSYRHEAAMELLFGQMRPTTIVKQMPAPQDDTPSYSPFQPYIPAYGDFRSWQSLPHRYSPFGAPNGCMWPTY